MIQFLYRKPNKKLLSTSRKYFLSDISAAVRRFYAERENNECEIVRIIQW